MQVRPRVVLIHGAGGGGWEWSIWTRVWAAAGWRDLRAIELQPAPAGLAATCFDHYLDQVCTAAAGAPVVLAGASLGGLLALCAAPRVNCRALVLVNPLPPLEEAGAWAAPTWPGDIVPWGREASLAGTRRAMAGADDDAALFAFRHWRDESAAVLRDACAGREVTSTGCPLLVIASEGDQDVPVDLSTRLALRLAGSLQRYAGGHLEPLLGRTANSTAAHAVSWLNAALGFTAD